jgi:cysteine desulfurase
VLEIVGLGKACELASLELETRTAHMTEMRDRLWSSLTSSIDGLIRNGDPDNCLPNTLSVALPDVISHTLLEVIGDEVAASAGSACHTGDVSISPVLSAMGVPHDQALGTVRFSVGRSTTSDEIDRAVHAVVAAVGRPDAT